MNHVAPRVRLVVPTTGQRLGYLEKCLESIREQGESVEIFIVGCAAAATLLQEVADTFGAQFLVERGRGISEAVNQGWEGARTEYVGWLGDDDLLAAGGVHAAAEQLDRNPAVAMVYGRVGVIDAQGNHIFTMRPGRFASWLVRYGQNFVWQPGSLYRRTAVRRVGMLDPSLRYAMDFDLHLRLRQQGGLSYVPQVLACFRAHPDSLTMSNPNPNDEPKMVMRRHLEPMESSLEPLWWPLVRCIGRVWGVAQYRTGRTRYMSRMLETSCPLERR